MTFGLLSLPFLCFGIFYIKKLAIKKAFWFFFTAIILSFISAVTRAFDLIWYGGTSPVIPAISLVLYLLAIALLARCSFLMGRSHE